jgi:hypothetical protein
MAFSAGVFSRLYSWVTDRDAGVKIRADKMDAEMDGMATGLSTAVLKDGSQTITANIPMSTFKFTGLGAGSTNGDSVRYEQITSLVTGPSSATDNAVTRFDGTTGKVVQDSGVTINDTGDLFIPVGAAHVVGHTANLSIPGALQITAFRSGAVGLGLGSFTATAGDAGQVVFYRSKNAAIGSATVVANGDVLGSLNWYGAQQTGTFSTQTRGARIRAEVSGTVTSGAGGDMPSSLIFSTTADGGSDVTDQVTIGPTGLVTLTAGQIAFPASQNASADANTFDDYEEGTFTPGMTFNGSATGVTFTTQSGLYTKVGRDCLYGMQITLTSNGTGVGTALITGLPFTPIGTINHACAVQPVGGFSGLTAGVSANATAGATTVNLRGPNTTGSAALTDTNVTDTATFYVGGHFPI